jgi:hypothetical protein
VRERFLSLGEKRVNGTRVKILSQPAVFEMIMNVIEFELVFLIN